MEGKTSPLKEALEEWLEQNFSSGYTSCIKIHGRPILPPLMSEERRMEMRRLKDMALEVESRLARKKSNGAQEDTAGGEAMYEGTAEELHFANSLPTSLVPNSNEVSESAQALDIKISCDEDISKTSTDMLKEFDPLAEANVRSSTASPSPPLFNINVAEISKKIPLVDVYSSKPNSAENSVALSCSTDLNQYMDITEGSVDMSIPCFDIDVKSSGGSRVTTPSTIGRNSADDKSHSSVPWREGKTTYEDLNNYLDSLLHNCGGSKNKQLKDRNQNVVPTTTSPETSQSTISPPSLPLSSNLYSNDPPPLISPQGSLQTKIVADNNFVSPRKNLSHLEHTSNFFQNCALSPVVRGDMQNSYESKVQSYLQNLMVDGGSVEGHYQEKSSQQPHSLQENLNSQSVMNRNPPQGNTEANGNGFAQAPPRLVRSNSYTLDSPSPMLLAHMEAELKKNVRNETGIDQASASLNPGPARRVWDVDSTKNMPNWSTRIVSNADSKVLSPKKSFLRSMSAQPTSSHSIENTEILVDASQKQIKCKSSNSPKSRKNLGQLPHQDNKDIVQGSNVHATSSLPVNDESKDKVRALLLQLQLQHNQEMEELINRQRKEKESIRLALLEEQRASVMRAVEESSATFQTSQVSSNPPANPSQSPPTKDSLPLVERRNTSPSIYNKEISEQLQSCLGQYSKSSSISLADVTSSIEHTKLIDLDSNGGDVQNTSTLQGLCTSQTMPPNICNAPSYMISSFPPCDGPVVQQESMTFSLPPEILSLYFANNELDSNVISSKGQSVPLNKPIPVPKEIVTAPQNSMPSAFTSNPSSGSPKNKRRSWCSRQLFPDDISQNHPDWVVQTYEIQAATKIQAGVRGYLTRRLLKTERVQNCITTIRDTIVCALQLQRDCAPHVEPSDLQLHGRLIQQLSAACEDLHNIFMGLSVSKRMAIIAADRERLRIRTPRSQSSGGSRPLSRATQIVLQRKLNQTDPTDIMNVHSRASSSNRSRRRSWAVESRVRPAPHPTTNNCEVVSGCLSRSSAPTSLPLQRSASAGSSRKPWR